MQTQRNSEDNMPQPNLYRPKDNHPWRRYKNKPVEQASEEELAQDKKLPSLYHFLKDIVENWDSYAIPANEYSNETVKLKNMAQPRSAAWIAAFMQKTWVKSKSESFEIYG